MIRDLQNFDKDDYVLLHGTVFYKEGDGLTDKIRYGYRTLFTYLKLYEDTLINKI